MILTISNEEKIKVTINPTTSAGNPAQVENPLFEVVSGDATIEQDGLSAYLISGEVGASQIKVSADADLGTGVTTLEELIDLNVVGASATSLGLVVEPAEPK